MSNFKSPNAAKILRLEVLLSVIEYDIRKLVWLYNRHIDNPETVAIIEMAGNSLIHVRDELRQVT